MPKNQVKDIKVLEKLTRLSTLDLGDNQVEDVGPLTKLTELKLLIIWRNKIKDLKPLVDAAKADAAGPKLFAPYLRLYIDGQPAVRRRQEDAARARSRRPGCGSRGERGTNCPGPSAR